MFEHHASYVILDLAHQCVEAAKRDDRDEAVRLAKLGSDIGRAFPEAKAEVEARYPSAAEDTP